ncbi:MAG: putative bifunctional diguanylate cyclase/phosphodiesterase [Polyangiales bacterium]
MERTEPLRILHLEDNEDDAALVVRQLERAGLAFTLKRAQTLQEYVGLLNTLRPELVLSDNSLPGLDSRGALSILHAQTPETPFILVSGTVGEERAAELLRSGANDYVLKDRLSRLGSAVERALVLAEERNARRLAQDALLASAEQVRQLADAMPQIVWAARPDGEIDYFNQRWYDFTGGAPGAVGLEQWESILHPDDRGPAMNRYGAAVRTGEPFEMECRFADRRNGEHRWHLCRAVPIRDSWSQISRWFGTATDIDDRKSAEHQLIKNAYYDTLTSLPNRALFRDRLEKAIHRASRAEDCLLAVLFLDIDRFKLVNDSLGHGAGDKLLSEFARRVERLVRPGDTVARFGGDEFAVFLPDLTSGEQATRIAERVLEGLAEPFPVDGHEIVATASIGVAVSTGAGAPETMLRDADSAMYRAKALGRGRCEMFDEEMHATSLEMLGLERDLRRALEHRELVIHYQPIISLDTGVVTGCEALVRWNHPERGLMQPDQFIPLAEETGLIVPMGAWVLETACQQMQTWLKRGMPPIDLAVNFSARQFKQKTLAERVARALTESGFDARRLQLELTESLLMEATETASTTLRELHALGVQLSIDDFGTGYSSLAYLKRLPWTALKIDRSFVRSVNEDHEDAAIATAVISLAHSLKLKVIAEGIETDAQRSFLTQRNCEEGQGYLFSHAVPAEAFIDLVERGTHGQ